MRTLLSLFIALLFLVPASTAAEKPPNFPAKPIEIIVPFAKGGGLDVSVRLLAKFAEGDLGQHVSVTNRSRGGNIQGNLDGIKAEPDGYTLTAWGNGLVTDQLIIQNVPYTHKDVTTLCMFANDPEVIVVGAEFARENGITTLADLFEHARENPGAISIGMGGNWTPHDFLRLKMETMAEVKFNRVPFLGGAPALKATAEGNCNVALPFVSELLPLLDGGDVLPLAVAFADRVTQLPDVPSVSECDYPDMTQSIWRVLTLPWGTPDSIVEYLESVFRKAIANPDFRTQAQRLGVNPMFMGSRDLRKFVEKEYEFYAEKTQEWGIRTR